MARVVAPGLPHHVTRRGNRRQEIFFSGEGGEACKALVAEHCRVAGVAVRACCLMPNHVHLILVPPDGDGRGLRELRQYIVAT
jgi:putative transposase